MFTGIVTCTGRITAVEDRPIARRLWIAPAGDLARETRPPRVGDSISVSGVCLTVAELGQGGDLGFDVVPETLRCTRLGELAVDARVNLEPAVAPQQPMGGHIVQGHIDGLGRVIELEEPGGEQGGEVRLVVEAPESLTPFLIPKGAIAVEGVSLTLASVGQGGRFEIALVPTTLEHTTLGTLAAGDRVHLETDIVSRTVVGYLQSRKTTGQGVTRQTLAEAGFAVDPDE